MRIRLFEGSYYPTEVSDSTEFDESLNQSEPLTRRDIGKIWDFLKEFGVIPYVSKSDVIFFKSFRNRPHSYYFSDKPPALMKKPEDGVGKKNLVIKLYWTTMIFMKYDIVKSDDDWFMVQFWDDVEFKFWKCDQLEGLMEFLKKDIPERIEYWNSRTDIRNTVKKL